MHFYESYIITTKDCMQLQVYGNEHPTNTILVKPKYIPTEKLESDALQCRFISGRKMNRLNMWADKDELKKYLEEFKEHYPDYIFSSDTHEGERLFFSVPIDKIERVYSPRRGLKELMQIPREKLDLHLQLIHDFVNFLLESDLKLKDFGITYSSLVGHYTPKVSDINIVVHGKDNYWNLMKFLESANHSLLRWKTEKDWNDFHKKRNRFDIFDEKEFLKIMSRKKSEGLFGDSLFVIFCVENEDETWFKWGEEKYYEKGFVEIEGIVKDNFNSIVRPGYYEIENSKIIEGYKDVPIKRVVFYSRDYASMCFSGEKIKAKGILEKVVSNKEEPYYRVVIGYFDSYLNERREKEYIKPIFEKSSEIPQINKFSKENCAFCKESLLNVGDVTDYGARIIYKVGNNENGWFAMISPKTGGNSEEDFSVQLSPRNHLVNFSEINNNIGLAKNYGIAFAKISYAVGKIMKRQDPNFKIAPIGTYGKCKHVDEHIHIKIFPWKNNVGQPYTTDSSFGEKKISRGESGMEFVKMNPVKKVNLSEERFDQLSDNLIDILNKK